MSGHHSNLKSAPGTDRMAVTICCQNATNADSVRGVGVPGGPAPVELPTDAQDRTRLIVGDESLGDRLEVRRCSPPPHHRPAWPPSSGAWGWRRSWSGPMSSTPRLRWPRPTPWSTRTCHRGSPSRRTAADRWRRRASSPRSCSRNRCRCRAEAGSTLPTKPRRQRSRWRPTRGRAPQVGGQRRERRLRRWMPRCTGREVVRLESRALLGVGVHGHSPASGSASSVGHYLSDEHGWRKSLAEICNEGSA